MTESLDSRPVRAVLFDVDGTLYHAAPLRRRIVAALLALPLRAPLGARHVWRHVRCYRQALEEVRHRPKSSRPVGEVHLERAAELAGADPDAVRSSIEEWMLRRPLQYLRHYRRRGLPELLDWLASGGLQVGFFSDYPVDEKLAALEIPRRSSLRLCATDPEVNAFKPWPDGFRRACALWELAPAEVLYVGDRPDVDAVGAAAAGVRCAILEETTRGHDASTDGYHRAGGCSAVRRLVERLL